MCVKAWKKEIWLAWGVLGNLQSRGHVGKGGNVGRSQS